MQRNVGSTHGQDWRSSGVRMWRSQNLRIFRVWRPANPMDLEQLWSGNVGIIQRQAQRSSRTCWALREGSGGHSWTVLAHAMLSLLLASCPDPWGEG